MDIFKVDQSEPIENNQVLEIFDNLYNLITSIINLLMIVNKKNYPNSIYTFQWYQLFKRFILDEDSKTKHFKMDDLVIQLFEETELNVSSEKDVQEIAKCIKIDSLNQNALNLLIAFCSFNAYRTKQELEVMIDSLLGNNELMKNIFIEFIIVEHKIFIENNNEKIEVTNKNISDYSTQFEYIGNVVKLSVELCKGNFVLVIDYFRKIYPLEVCLLLISSSKLSPLFRSLFVDLFTQGYLAYDCRYIPIKTFPNNIKLKHDFSSNKENFSELSKIQKTIQDKYFFEKKDAYGDANSINLKSKKKF